MADDPTDPLDTDQEGGARPTDDVESPGASEDGPTKASTPTSTAGSAKPVVRKKIVSKRVTPKGGPVSQKGARPARGGVQGSTAARAHAPDGEDADYSSRYTPPTAKYADGPSPTWVPVLMFALLGLGALLIVLNYAGVFGDADNMRLIIGLVLILGGIVTATNLR